MKTNYTTKCGCKFTNIRFRKGSIKSWSTEYCDDCEIMSKEVERLEGRIEEAEEEMKQNVK